MLPGCHDFRSDPIAAPRRGACCRLLVVGGLALAVLAPAAAGATTLCHAAGRAPWTESPTSSRRLPSGATLFDGQSLVSPNGRFTLDMQGDGNLVLYGAGLVLWDSGTVGDAPRLRHHAKRRELRHLQGRCGRCGARGPTRRRAASTPSPSRTTATSSSTPRPARRSGTPTPRPAWDCSTATRVRRCAPSRCISSPSATGWARRTATSATRPSRPSGPSRRRPSCLAAASSPERRRSRSPTGSYPSPARRRATSSRSNLHDDLVMVLVNGKLA